MSATGSFYVSMTVTEVQTTVAISGVSSSLMERTFPTRSPFELDSGSGRGISTSVAAACPHRQPSRARHGVARSIVRPTAPDFVMLSNDSRPDSARPVAPSRRTPGTNAAADNQTAGSGLTVVIAVADRGGVADQRLTEAARDFGHVAVASDAVVADQPNLSRLRNRAAAVAGDDIIILLDADIAPESLCCMALHVRSRGGARGRRHDSICRIPEPARCCLASWIGMELSGRVSPLSPTSCCTGQCRHPSWRCGHLPTLQSAAFMKDMRAMVMRISTS